MDVSSLTADAQAIVLSTPGFVDGKVSAYLFGLVVSGSLAAVSLVVMVAAIAYYLRRGRGDYDSAAPTIAVIAGVMLGIFFVAALLACWEYMGWAANPDAKVAELVAACVDSMLS